jgi:hypothetical protein
LKVQGFKAQKWIKLFMGICLLSVLYACSNVPSTSALESADYGPPPTVGQIMEGVRALGGEAPELASRSSGQSARDKLSQGWATDLDNPGGFIYGWQYRFQQTAENGGGIVTALFHDGILIAATRDTAGQAAPTRIK